MGAGVSVGTEASVEPGGSRIATVGGGEAVAATGAAGVAAGLGPSGTSGVAAALHPNATKGTRSTIKVKGARMPARRDRVAVEGIARCRWSIGRASKHQHSGSPCHEANRPVGLHCNGAGPIIHGKFGEIVELERGLDRKESQLSGREGLA